VTPPSAGGDASDQAAEAREGRDECIDKQKREKRRQNAATPASEVASRDLVDSGRLTPSQGRFAAINCVCIISYVISLSSMAIDS
jgi:hypothetical protein